MKILDGKSIAEEISKELKNKISKSGYTPRLAIFQIGDNPSSNKYINFKIKKAEEIGINAVLKKIDDHFPQEKLIEDIKDISPWVDGIIIQLPLPEGYDTKLILNSVPHNKDVDGLSEGNTKITPATPRGIMTLLKNNNIEIKNKVIAVVGQSNLVGKPLSNLFSLNNAKEVIRIDKKTGLSGTERADILVVAAGHPNLIKEENIKSGVVIIDVGVNLLSNGKITGDVDRDSVGEIPSMISPVIGGVGPMTVISLFQNLVDNIK